MRGNLVWKNTERTTIDFVPDENGEYEVVDGGRITQRNNFLDSNVDYRQEKLDDNFWNDDRVIEFVTMMKMKDCSLSDLNEFKKTELHFAVENFGTPHWSDEVVREFKRRREKYLLHAQVKQSQPESNPDDENYKNYFLERDRRFLLSEPNPELKDCVITAFESRAGNIWKKSSREVYSPDGNIEIGGYSYEGMVEMIGKAFEIYSVKRLSDEIEFTLQEETNYGIIGLFFIKDGKMFIQQDKTIGKGFGGVPLSSLTKKKEKEVLFTTEDGVGIYDGEKVHLVRSDFGIGYCFNVHNPELYKNTDEKYFSTKEKAEEYILLNKPVLSVQDVLGIQTDKMNEWIYFSDLERLISEVAKKKMKA